MASNIAFHLLPMWLQSLVAINSELRLTLFPSFCLLPSEVAVLFYSNLSKRPFLGQDVDLDLLHCTGFNNFNLEHAVLFLCHISNKRSMTDRKIKQSNGCCFGRQQFLTNSIEIFISHENKKWLAAVQNLQSLQVCIYYKMTRHVNQNICLQLLITTMHTT